MHAKNNRLNTNFQILHFLAGSCHTADGAYALLCDLRENRSDALKMAKSSILRNRAKRLAAERKINGTDEIEKLEGLADLEELQAGEETWKKNLQAAEEELQFIEECIGKLQPFRKFAHLTDPEAFAACQREEWRLELINRAENALFTTGTIPADDFKTMRMHPDFKNSILPEIGHIKQTIETGTIQERLFPKVISPFKLLLADERIQKLIAPNGERLVEFQS